jgi:homoserine kinase type II
VAVYTDISEIELAAFLRDYDIGELLSYKGIAEGVENSNFLLHTSSGAYILTLYEKRVNRDDLPFFVAIVTFLEGMWMRRPTVEHCREVGRALAAMHLAGQDFAIRRPNALSVSGWRPLWERARARADEVETGLVAEVETDLAMLEREWPADLPSGVIHADLFPDNVFFLGRTLSGLIDFYFACNDLLAYDVAICLNAWCFEKDNSFNLTKGRALLGGYTAVRPLSPAEAEALPVLARGSALRFMLTRLYDWLNTPAGSLVVKKDPLEYLRRMRFHRQVRSPSEYGLEMDGALA